MTVTLSAQARKALKFLGTSGASLVHGDTQDGSFLRLEARQMAGDKRRQLLVEAAALAGLKRQGLIREAPDGAVRLSTDGRMYLRRVLSSGSEEFQAQHQARVRVKAPVPGVTGEDALITVNLAESPLAWLARRKDSHGKAMLSAEQVEAGERLRADYTFAAMMPSIAGGWRTEAGPGRNTGRGPAGPEVSDSVLAARLRVERALEATGRGLGGVLVDVCCLLKGLETVERERGWPVRSAKVVLGIGLSTLAAHYGMTARRGKTGRSGVEPSIKPTQGQTLHRP